MPVDTLYYITPLFLISLFLIRKVIYSFLDPLVLTIYAMSCSIGVMFRISYPAGLVDDVTAFVFVISHFAFILGLVVANYTSFKLTSHRHLHSKDSFIKISLLWTLVMLVIILMITLATTGLNIFQDAPQDARTAVLFSGAGIFKRSSFAGTSLALVLILVLNFHHKINKVTSLLCFAFLAFIMISGASKGALFGFFTAFIYYRIYLKKNHQINLTLKTQLWAVFLIGIVLAGAITVSTIDIARTKSLAVDQALMGALERVGNRMIEFGDIGYLFFAEEAYIKINKSPLDYFSYLTNEPLAVFRLAEYQKSPGAEIYAIVSHSPNLEGRGPNMQVTFAGVLYFGYFGVIYSFIIGFLTSFMRRVILLSFNKTNLDMVIFILINGIIAETGIDTFYVFSRLFSLGLILCPLFIVFVILYTIFNIKNPLVWRWVDKATPLSS